MQPCRISLLTTDCKTKCSGHLLCFLSFNCLFVMQWLPFVAMLFDSLKNLYWTNFLKVYGKPSRLYQLNYSYLYVPWPLQRTPICTNGKDCADSSYVNLIYWSVSGFGSSLHLLLICLVQISDLKAYCFSHLPWNLSKMLPWHLIFDSHSLLSRDFWAQSYNLLLVI